MKQLSNEMKIEAKQFYKNLATIVGPIAIQNLISATVSSADVVMLGYVGQTAIAASSLANQVQLILFLIFTGISSGLIMLTAQYWGKKDMESIKTLSGIALRFSCASGLFFAIAAFFFPRQVMFVFTNDANLISTGSIYLKAVSISYLCMSISQIYQAVLRSIEKVKTVTVLTFITLGLNVFLNAVFIFGLFGAPKLGIFGVALATSIARVFEVIAYIIIGTRIKEIKLSLTLIFRYNKLLFSDFMKYSLPALGNEFVWGLAFTMYSAILGHLGEDIVAANSVVGVIRNLATVLCFGMAYGGAIILGKEMGAGLLDRAKRNAKRLVRSTIACGLVAGIIILLLKPLMYILAELKPLAASYRDTLLWINALSIVGAAINTVFICGVFRAGGDAKFGFILDCIIMWAVSIPLGLLSAFVFKLPPLVVYFILYMDEFEKMAFVIIHYFKGAWLKNITRENIK